MRRSFHPIVYTLLIAPFGAANGFATVALAFRATASGLTVNQGAQIVAIFMGPAVFKFFWAPIGDLTLTRKRWYLVSAAAVAATFFALCVYPLSPSTFRLVEGLVLLNSIAATFLGFAVEGLAAHLTAPEDRGRVSGWFQAGNLGGTGIGGGAALWLLTHTSSTLAGVGMVLLTLVCALGLPRLPDIANDASGQSVAAAVRILGVDLWALLRSRKGLLSLLLLILPVGTGAATSVLAQADVAAHWHATVDQVALTQGFLSGVLSGIGAIVGGYLCNWLKPIHAYALFGVLMAAVAAAMAFLPATSIVYIGSNFGYSFTSGLCYAAFGAVTLDAIGKGAAATKYNGFASISNLPITYMGLILAEAFTRYGPDGLLWTECLCGLGGVALFYAMALGTQRRGAAAPAVA